MGPSRPESGRRVVLRRARPAWSHAGGGPQRRAGCRRRRSAAAGVRRAGARTSRTACAGGRQPEAADRRGRSRGRGGRDPQRREDAAVRDQRGRTRRRRNPPAVPAFGSTSPAPTAPPPPMAHDRQPEFTQIDVEVSFATEEIVYGIVEGAVAAMFAAAGYKVTTPFPRISYDDAMRRYGSDKPDLRPGMEIADLLPVFAADLPEFVAALPEADRAIRGFVVAGAGTYSRKQLDDLVATAATLGGRIAWARVGD